jgi:hypothetical protein
MTRWDAAAHRTAELDLLSAVSVVMHNASTEAAPVRQRTEGEAAFGQRWEAYAKRCGFATFRTVFGHARVINARTRLERFARDVQRCGGYRPGKPHGPARDREAWPAFQAATARDAHRFGTYSDEALAVLCVERKAYALKIMRQRWDGEDCGPATRLSLARDIEGVQREMVRRGLLDATDHDKVNAEPVREDVPECEEATRAPAPTSVSARDAAETAILAALNACLDDAAQRYPKVGRLMPAVRFDVRGQRCLAQAVRKGKAYSLRFNLAFLASHPEHVLRSTIPHEVAHLVADASGHGFRHCAHWRAICVALGGNGKRLSRLEPTAAPAPAPTPVPARPLRAVPPSPVPALRADAVEHVEAIETTDGRLVLAVFDEDIELLGLYEGFESRILAPQALRVALAAPAAGAIHGWPAACADAQATYDRLTEHRGDYNVIGRWSRDEGLDLIELKLSRLLGRGPRAILGRPLAA